MPNLNAGILGSVSVVIPSKNLLVVFEDVIAGTEARRAHNSQQIQTPIGLRDSLLPRLISGSLRLPEAQAALAEAAC